MQGFGQFQAELAIHGRRCEPVTSAHGPTISSGVGGAIAMGNSQPSFELNVLLSLGPTPTEAEVSSVLQADLGSWRKNPRLATVALHSLAKKRLPHVSVHVLTAMQANRVEVDVYHCNAAIVLAQKAANGSWHSIC
ncbi:unnamed protein product [Polarella glacialis]|uniref:Uncharacterized protein n=1 Tax=Polarella glacialis TaxID=89957 RepID=A0A813EMJ2_POLGL|nr:unnamed protein product [Polarella glacialis]CAE8725124.1 unnamed protein product [Polarella glacialis]